jgi:hypothetical protein
VGLTVKAHANASGYVYVNIPHSLCQQCSISKQTVFMTVVEGGKLILKQEV